jgi:hypothetical protein
MEFAPFNTSTTSASDMFARTTGSIKTPAYAAMHMDARDARRETVNPYALAARCEAR